MSHHTHAHMLVSTDSPTREGGRDVSEIQLVVGSPDSVMVGEDWEDDTSLRGSTSKDTPMSFSKASSSADHLSDMDKTSALVEEDERGPPGGTLARWKNCKPPSHTWTTRHTLYFAFLGCVVPTLVCFAVNFGVAVAIFRGNPSPTIWSFPIPLAGNYAAVILVQTIINLPLFGTLATLDILNGLAPPLLPQALGIVDFDSETWLGWLMLPPELFLAPVDAPAKSYLSRIITTIQRVGAWFVISFIPLWPLFTGITFAIWGSDGFNDYPQPQFISSVLGAVLALTTCPAWVLVALVDMGRRIESERYGGPGGGGAGGGSRLFKESSLSVFSDIIPAPSPGS